MPSDLRAVGQHVRSDRCHGGRARAACRGASAWSPIAGADLGDLQLRHVSSPRSATTTATALGLADRRCSRPFGHELLGVEAAQLGDLVGTLQALQPCDGGASATLMAFDEPSDLAQHVVDAGLLEDGPRRAAGDDAGTGGGGLEQTRPAPGSPITGWVMVRAGERHGRRGSSSPPRCPSGWRAAPPWPCRSRGRPGRRRRRSPRAR